MKESKQTVIQALKYTVIAASAGIIQVVSFSLLEEVLHLPYWPSYLIALTLSVLWNFTFNRKYTFQSANNVPKAMFLVFLYYLVFTPTSTWFGNYLTSKGVNDYITLIINMVINFITEFLFQKYVVFKKED
ncbi:MAG: GtrA family protein [Erysipelotrichaceae bacterium]|nr:GtrA family protein [Erysipelotrichaceae bacterium]